MSCEHLICAQCAGPVAEGRCPTCRQVRDQMHRDARGLNVQLVLGVLLVLALLALAATRLAVH
jgi:hypothetical protein